MHGKITYYNTNNGIGAIMDHNKRLYEFRANTWHDTTTLPGKGMLAEFRLDEATGNVTDCKASKYQGFEPDGFVFERDFWASETDDILSGIEEERREDVIKSKADGMDLDEVDTVPENRDLEQCIGLYFVHQNRILNKYRDYLESSNCADQMDYFKLKRFIDKALEQLKYYDKRVSEEDFHDVKQEISELEHSLQFMSRFKNQNSEELFKQVYVHKQVEYLAVSKRLALEEEEIFSLEKRIEKVQAENKALNEKIAQLPPEKSEKKKEMQLKIRRNQEILLQLQTEMEEKNRRKSRLDSMVDGFLAPTKDKFESVYEQYKEKIIRDMEMIINLLANKIDQMIWERATHSETIQNNFYKPGSYGAYCTMTYVYYYLKPLNKSKLRPEDNQLFNLWREFDQHQAKKVVVISEDQNLLHRIKVLFLGKDKTILIRDLTRPVEFFSYMKQDRADLVIVDSTLKSIKATDLILKGREVYKNRDKTEFILFVG